MFNLEPNLFAASLLTVVSVINVVGFLGQIIQLLRTKKAEGFSLTSWSIWTFGCLSLFVYALVFTGDIGLVLTNLLNFILHGAILLLVIIYRPKG